MSGHTEEPADQRAPASDGIIAGLAADGRLGAASDDATDPGRAPSRSRVSIAWQATRPLYIPTSLLPGFIGIAAAINARGARWWLAPIAIIALGLAHAGVNCVNDVEDFARGVDPEDKLNNSKVFTAGLMSVHDGRVLGRGLFLASFALGVFIAIFQGWVLFIIGVVGLIVGYGYTAGPRPLKYEGLGEVAIIPVMGPLITQGAYTAVTGHGFAAAPFWIGFAPGLLIAAVLAANNLADIPGDRTAGVRTLAVRLGFPRARVIYLSALGLAYVVPVAAWAAGLFGVFILLPLLTLALVAGQMRQAAAVSAEGDERLLPLVPGAAQVHGLVCVLLIVGIVLDRV
jgi:1,4-dihydroxy-2-naphthoate octaprenyltransferase